MMIPIAQITIGKRRRTARKAAEISESIAQLGLLNPITVDKDYNLIAGLNRLEACKLLAWEEIPCNVVELSGLQSQLAEIDENIVRDDLTVLEGANWMRDRKKIYEEIYPDTRQGMRNGQTSKTAESAILETEIFEQDPTYLSAKNAPSFVESTAALVKKAERTIRQEIQISEELEKYNDDLADLPIADQKTQLLQLAQTAKKDEKLAEKIVAELKKEPESGKSVAEITKEIKATEKKEELIEKKLDYEVRVEEKANDTQSVDIFSTENKFRVIYADPAWSYNDKQDTPKLGGAAKHYDTMSTTDICNLPIKNIADKDAVLFLWVTSPLLPDGLEVIEAWGFKYKSSFIWDKVGHVMGHYNSVRHEFLLIATKGSCTPDVKVLIDSVVSIEKTNKHSEKPKEFREMIDKLYTHGERIELFCRTNDDKKWHVWGNEV